MISVFIGDLYLNERKKGAERTEECMSERAREREKEREGRARVREREREKERE